MCEPTTALLIAGTVMSAAGTGYSALMANAQARGAAAQARANQAEANRSAADAIERGNIEQRDFYRKISQQRGAQIATMAANGLDVDFGSAAEIIDDTNMYAREDAASLASNTRNETRGFMVNAANYASEARSAKLAAKGALEQGAFGVASTILGGAQQYRGLKSPLSSGRNLSDGSVYRSFGG